MGVWHKSCCPPETDRTKLLAISNGGTGNTCCQDSAAAVVELRAPHFRLVMLTRAMKLVGQRQRRCCECSGKRPAGRGPAIAIPRRHLYVWGLHEARIDQICDRFHWKLLIEERVGGCASMFAALGSRKMRPEAERTEEDRENRGGEIEEQARDFEERIAGAKLPQPRVRIPQTRGLSSRVQCCLEVEHSYFLSHVFWLREGGLCLTFDTGVLCWSFLPSVTDLPWCLPVASHWPRRLVPPLSRGLRLWQLAGAACPALDRLFSVDPSAQSCIDLFRLFGLTSLRLKHDIVSTQLLRRAGRQHHRYTYPPSAQ
jgi:hypothetical protein